MTITVPHTTYPDGSQIVFSDVPSMFWARSPRGWLADPETRGRMLYETVERAAAALAELGRGPAATTKRGA